MNDNTTSPRKRVTKKALNKADTLLNQAISLREQLTGLFAAVDYFDEHLGGTINQTEGAAVALLKEASTQVGGLRPLIAMAVKSLDEAVTLAHAELVKLVGAHDAFDLLTKSESFWKADGYWPILVGRASRHDIMTTTETLVRLRNAGNTGLSHGDLSDLGDVRSRVDTLNHLGWTIGEEPSDHFRLVAAGGAFDAADKEWEDTPDNRLNLLRLIVVLQCGRVYATTGETGLGS